ncbi:MAG TPA: PadR family transcriptional regulator [Terriglobales bacterium]|nr:PadR family transcriptional regulator [Terriglobales bacterium]
MNDRIVLALLLDGPRHGYALAPQAGLILARGPLHNNVIYPLLRRFAARGWVRARAAAGARGRTRKLYALSAAGRREVQRRLKSFTPRDAQTAGAFQLRAGLFGMLTAAERRRILAAGDQVLAGREQKLRAMLAHFRPAGFPAAVLRFRLRETTAERRFLERLARLATDSKSVGGRR